MRRCVIWKHYFDERKEALTAKLKEMVSSIFTKEHLLVSVTCEKDGVSIVEAELEKFIPMLYETSGEEKRAEIVPVQKNEGFMDASQVQYVARAGNYVRPRIFVSRCIAHF